MTYNYSTSNGPLKIEFDPKNNIALVYLKDEKIHTIGSRKELAQGKIIPTPNGSELFLKLINIDEGFTVMLDSVHSNKSAGNPKILLKRTLLPIRIGTLAICTQFVYIVWDLFNKKELVLETITTKTISYLGYYGLIITLMAIGYLFAKRGSWKGIMLVIAVLITNFLVSFGIGIYYGTGFNLFVLAFFVGHLIALILLYSQSNVITYVIQYRRELNQMKQK